MVRQFSPAHAAIRARGSATARSRLPRSFGWATIGGVETFLCLERTLLRHVAESLLLGPSQPLLDLAQSRQSRFWSEVTPTFQAH